MDGAIQYKTTIETGFLHHKYDCRKARISQYFIHYSFNQNGYQEIGVKLGHHLFKPRFKKIAIVPTIALLGSYYTFNDNEGYKLMPEWGISFIFKRKESPYVGIDILYNYMYYPWTKSGFGLADHQIRILLGLGLIN